MIFFQVISITELKEKLRHEKLPDQAQITEQSGKLIVFHLNIQDNPEIKSSIVIFEDLTYKLFVRNSEIPLRNIAHISKSKCSMIVNTMDYLKNFTETTNKNSTKDTVLLVCNIIDKLCDHKGVNVAKLSFLKEQISLAVLSKYSRRYSPSLYATAALWENRSASL